KGNLLYTSTADQQFNRSHQAHLPAPGLEIHSHLPPVAPFESPHAYPCGMAHRCQGFLQARFLNDRLSHCDRSLVAGKSNPGWHRRCLSQSRDQKVSQRALQPIARSEIAGFHNLKDEFAKKWAHVEDRATAPQTSQAWAQVQSSHRNVARHTDGMNRAR